jgi:hypothetical protein
VEEARVPGQPPTIGKQVVNFIIRDNSKPNLAEMFSMRSYTRVVTFVQIRQKTWPPRDFENSDWSIFKKLLLKASGKLYH